MVELTNALVDAVVTTGKHASGSSTSVMVIVDDLRQGVLAALEATVQSAVTDQQNLSQLSYFPLLAPLSRLISESKNVELQAAGLRLLTDLLPSVFKVEKSIENMRLSDLLRVVLPTVDHLMDASDPLPTLTASFLLGCCQISPKVVKSLATSKKTMEVIVTTLWNYERRPATLIVQHLLEILDVILAQPTCDLSLFLQPNLIEAVITIVNCLFDSLGTQLNQTFNNNAIDSVSRPLLAVLSIINNILRHVALAARKAIQARQQGNPSAVQETAEEALKTSKGLTQLDAILVSLLLVDDGDIVDTAASILSLLAQLYGPSELHFTLTEDNVHVWVNALGGGTQMSLPPAARAKSLLRTLRRLVQQPDSAPARFAAKNCDGLKKAVERLSTSSFQTTSSAVSAAEPPSSSTATEVASIIQLANEISAALK